MRYATLTQRVMSLWSKYVHNGGLTRAIHSSDTKLHKNRTVCKRKPKYLPWSGILGAHLSRLNSIIATSEPKSPPDQLIRLICWSTFFLLAMIPSSLQHVIWCQKEKYTRYTPHLYYLWLRLFGSYSLKICLQFLAAF